MVICRFVQYQLLICDVSIKEKKFVFFLAWDTFLWGFLLKENGQIILFEIACANKKYSVTKPHPFCVQCI